MVKRVVISGCSGGGKSSIIGALAAKGYTTFTEPGRQVVQTESASGGT
ncbi:MAG: AAA family ATPase, partial [Pseudomonadota bacterium]